MKRKIIKQGHNTLTITLPSEWVNKFNLSSGDEVDLSAHENGLFVTAEKVNDKKRAEFDITGMDIPIIWKYFMAVYREGYEEVVVKFDPEMEIESPYKFLTVHRLDSRYKKEREKKRMLENLQGFVNRFIGFEIVENGKDYIIIKEMGQLTSKEFDNSLRRIFLLLKQMSEDTLEAIKTNNPKGLQRIHDVDINLDKFHDYCVRILNKNGYKETRKASLLFSTLYLLELMGDEFKNISHHLIQDFSSSKFKNIEQFAESVKEQIDAYYSLFYKFEKDRVDMISEIDKKTYFMFPIIYKQASEEEKEIFHHLRIIQKYVNALNELRIEMEY